VYSADSASQIGIFDISGSTITPRANFATFTAATDLVFPDASTLYGGSNGVFFRWSVDANGLKSIDSTNLTGFGGSNGSYRLANGLIYGFAGGIANPSTNPPSQVAQLAVSTALGPNSFVQAGSGVAPDPASGQAFLLAASNGPLLLAYDNTSYNLVNLQQFTGPNQGLDLLRWGRDGLAWHCQVSGFGNTPGDGQVVLVRGPFVLPEWLSANPTPGLTSVTPSNAGAGSNITLSVTGSKFVPGAVLLWNGAERTSTFVDSSHLTVAIPVSDLSKSGTATLVVNNPGSGNSSSVSFTIN